MNWQNIISAVLAGGLAGQLVTLFISNKQKSRQDINNWLRTERYKVFCELLDLVSATAPRTDYDVWPTNIRKLCQKAHLLYPGGTAPKEVADTMERLYQLARQRKHNEITDHDAWTDLMRDETRLLRAYFSGLLNNKTD